MTKSGIEWTDRSDWNPMRGCTRVSEGCRNCYAERIAGRFSAPGQPFHGFTTQTPAGARWTGKVEMVPGRLDLPLRWRKPSRIFVNSAFDLFHESVPDEWIEGIFGIMAAAPQHIFQVLTKRAGRMRRWFDGATLDRCQAELASRDLWPAISMLTARTDYINGPWPLPNVWLGVSAEDQARADERIPHLLATPAAVRWVSAEPLLGPMDLMKKKWRDCYIEEYGGPGSELVPLIRGIDWIVAGGESGPGARPMHPDWARSLRDQCAWAGVPLFFKQWGEWRPLGPLYSDDDKLEEAIATYGDVNHDRIEFIDRRGGLWGDEQAQPPSGAWAIERVGKSRAGRLLDGREHNGMPGHG